MKTKIKILLAVLLISTQVSNTFAVTQVGTGSVSGTWAFNANIMWNDLLPGTASGSVTWIIVKARVIPILNMVISTWTIDLWNINYLTSTTWSLNIEIGTNANNGVTVSVKSWSGGLYNTSNSGAIINNLSADGVAEDYTFASSLSGASDSTVAGYTQTSNLNTQINSNSGYTIYTTNDPEQSSTWVNDITFSVGAKSNIQTPSGDYKDILTFTVIGNF